MTLRFEIGVLFSLAGSYAAVGEAMYAGAMLAVDEVNKDDSLGVRLAVRAADPRGVQTAYVKAVERFLTSGIRHVVGCYTSSSRKEVLPLFEKRDALLWYPSHYEGFETTDNVVYTGAAPNQHVIPLAQHLIGQGRRTAVLVGSNYIWAWENNRIVRETLAAAGGRVLSERYFPVGERDLDDVVAQILDQPPDFVFSTLIGDSAYVFYRKLRAAARARGLDQPSEVPVASCSLAEPELSRLGDAAAGHLSSSVYFSSIETPQNTAFRRAWSRRFPALGETSADAEATYVAVHLLARSLARARTDQVDEVRTAAGRLAFEAPQGRVRVDPENRHLHMRARIGRSRPDGTFDILYQSASPIRPDPYLVVDGGVAALEATTRLRVVS